VRNSVGTTLVDGVLTITLCCIDVMSNRSFSLLREKSVPDTNLTSFTFGALSQLSLSSSSTCIQ